jgi:electron transport complex protein RnfB
VDAIVGAAKLMHTVIAAECTGCELCVAPCPVDCIDLVPVNDPDDSKREQVMARAQQARKRYEQHQARKARDQAEKAQRLAERAAVAAPSAVVPDTKSTSPQTSAVDKNDLIRKAMERAAALRAAKEEADKDKP